MGRGADVERGHINALDDLGIPAIRTPGSGSATTRALPDILFKCKGRLYAIEQKYTSGDYVYFDTIEIKKLCEFAYAWGAEPLMCARFAHDTDFYFQYIDEEKLMDPNYTWGMKRNDRDDYWTIQDLLE